MIATKRAAAIVSMAFFAMAAGRPVAPETKARDKIERQAFDLRDRFMAAVKACGVVPAFEPGIVVETHPGVVAYFEKDRSAYLSRWADIPPPIKEMMEAWAANGPLRLNGEAHFAEIFNSLLLPHELGHYLQSMSGRWDGMDRWESEVEANRIAIAFWSLDPVEAKRLPNRIENFTGFLEKLPSPVPKGMAPRDYFNANYEKLGNDAKAYGWYQGAFMRTAWNERAETNFCDLARLKAPA